MIPVWLFILVWLCCSLLAYGMLSLASWLESPGFAGDREIKVIIVVFSLMGPIGVLFGLVLLCGFLPIFGSFVVETRP